MKLLATLLLVVSTQLANINGANILGVFPITGHSHKIIYESLLKALAARGHNVTVITSYPQKTPVPNYTDIALSLPTAVNSLSLDLVLSGAFNKFFIEWFIGDMQLNNCRNAFNNPKVQELLKSGIKFDAVFTELFGSDCDVGYAYYFKAPLLSIITSTYLPWSYERVGGPDNPSYIPTLVTQASGKMDFVERFINTFYYIYFKISHKFISEWPADKFLKESFGPDTPYIYDILYNTSMVFVNSHFTLEGPRPLVPNMVEIGGIHIKPPQPLPKDILNFIEESPNGVLYFTFGSLIRVSSLPKETIEIFKDVFSKLPVRVLWKFEEEMPNKPDNVYISNWLPQRDILAHPKVRVFMTHGGHQSLTEAVHCGVPVVGIPFYFDQPANVVKLVHRGCAVLQDYKSITRESLYNSINTILSNSSYQLNAKKMSKLFNDRPLSAMDTAVYWTEYVIRHKGAPHLRTAAVGMPWWKYFLVDVIAFILTVVFIILYIIYFLLRACYRKCTKKSMPKKKVKKN